ncbi:MAG: radical SAM family heme chaperone HemW [Defluviitaleaceae bacterium]|nr:radical SAM family heme chaperone HemW [Defluviitaleaceae bacterium]MCL2239187.1 radical SAM family heme chaperone HemW [Defluviitaleaceae bacterium]
MIYIHIPFCRSKCAYCDFLSFADKADNATREVLMADYTQALLAELEAARRGDMGGCVIDTVYIGGGTPTALPASFLCEIIAGARRFRLAPGAEITVEMNPGNISTGSNPLPVAALKAVGVNRLSIGLQAWQDFLLARIQRAHTAGDFMQTFRAARDAGFDNINVDLMFSLPGQTMDMWRESLEGLIALRPEHISAYSLTPAQGTPLWDWLEAGAVTLPDDEADRAMYRDANALLERAGYRRYEISNYALPGRESRHNVNTWKRRPYRGFGLGAHSFEGSAEGGGTRWHNTEDMGKYLHAWKHKLEGGCREDITPLTPAEAMAETLILGLRLTRGVDEEEFRAAFGKNIRDCYGAQVQKHIAGGLLAREKNRLFLTPLGTDLANQVFMAFIAE